MAPGVPHTAMCGEVVGERVRRIVSGYKDTRYRSNARWSKIGRFSELGSEEGVKKDKKIRYGRRRKAIIF